MRHMTMNDADFRVPERIPVAGSRGQRNSLAQGVLAASANSP